MSKKSKIDKLERKLQEAKKALEKDASDLVHKKSKRPLLISLISVAVLIIILTILFIPVSYSRTEYYQEKEPYTRDDCNNENLRYLIEGLTQTESCLNQICDSHTQVCVEKNFWGNCIEYQDQCTHYACTRYRKNCKLTIENIDDTAGTWKVDGYSIIDSSQNLVNTLSIYVQPTKTSSGSWSFDYDAGHSAYCTYKNIRPAQKQTCDKVIDYRYVQKSRQVNDYKWMWKVLAENIGLIKRDTNQIQV